MRSSNSLMTAAPLFAFSFDELRSPLLELVRLEDGGHGALEILDERIHLLP